ncbi:MAG: hypothetical protein NUV69_05650 [Candidatus Curtissbacteria bacterium]|nr:hypothetical protein [Candidatus Curtissbacteria bacterium]
MERKYLRRFAYATGLGSVFAAVLIGGGRVVNEDHFAQFHADRILRSLSNDSSESKESPSFFTKVLFIEDSLSKVEGTMLHDDENYRGYGFRFNDKTYLILHEKDPNALKDSRIVSVFDEKAKSGAVYKVYTDHILKDNVQLSMEDAETLSNTMVSDYNGW